jgi:branched-chain amino acid transport system substrate-binding protein
MWSAGAYAQVGLFALALENAGTLDTQRLVDAAHGLSYEAPEGSIQIDPENNHTWLTPRIGRLRKDGVFDIVWEAKAACGRSLSRLHAAWCRWIGDETEVQKPGIRRLIEDLRAPEDCVVHPRAGMR